MLDMPPPRFIGVNGVRLRVYEAGPRDDKPPLVLLHGWPEIAFTWRRQIKALSEAGVRVIAPDQRGFGASDSPEAIRDYDIAHLTGDLAALLDELEIDKAVFVGHDWGGFVAWEMPLHHPDRVAGVVALNTPHLPRAPVDPIAILRKRYGERMYIVQFQNPGDEPERIFAAHADQLFDAFLRAPVPPRARPTEAAIAGVGAAPGLNLDFPALAATYDPSRDSRPRLLTPEERKVFVDAYAASGFTGGLNWYRNITHNWENSAGQDRTIHVPALMIMAELDPVQPPSAADGMEALVPDLERYLVSGCGHWTQEERPDEVSAKLIEWRGRRFG
jgi:pimeloyl-ACP methyl ester carboxylesterase